MKKYLTLHHCFILALAIAVVVLSFANYDAKQEIKALNSKIQAHTDAKPRLLDAH